MIIIAFSHVKLLHILLDSHAAHRICQTTNTIRMYCGIGVNVLLLPRHATRSGPRSPPRSKKGTGIGGAVETLKPYRTLQRGPVRGSSNVRFNYALFDRPNFLPKMSVKSTQKIRQDRKAGPPCKKLRYSGTEEHSHKCSGGLSLETFNLRR